jgi:hypothetical protein
MSTERKVKLREQVDIIPAAWGFHLVTYYAGL